MGRYPHPVYGWDPVELYRNLDLVALNDLREAICADPANTNPAHARGDIYLYTKSARRKLDALSWAVTYHLMDRKAA